MARLTAIENWRRIGAALAVGKAYALRITDANAAWSSSVFNQWMKERGFGAMPAPVRFYAVELHENLAAIETWRATLPEKETQATEERAKCRVTLAHGNGGQRKA